MPGPSKRAAPRHRTCTRKRAERSTRRALRRRVDDGFRDDKGHQHIAAASSRDAKDAIALDDAATREILAVEVSATGDDRRTPSNPQSSMTQGDGTISIDAFGHRSGALRHDTIARIENHVRAESGETLL
ncbi:MAG TPA: hypothetical protein VFF00_09195 [Candidatus Elarobacter sp.]|nr:hypothetical protein [Candidatus Elarobacter sp.]